MSEVTYYVALPFVAADDGVVAGEAVECFNHRDPEVRRRAGRSERAVTPVDIAGGNITEE